MLESELSVREKLFETGRGTKSLIGLLVLSGSILTSTFVMGMKIQRLVDGLITVTNQHQTILDGLNDLRGRPCK